MDRTYKSIPYAASRIREYTDAIKVSEETDQRILTQIANLGVEAALMEEGTKSESEIMFALVHILNLVAKIVHEGQANPGTLENIGGILFQVEGMALSLGAAAAEREKGESGG